jgi:ATP-dependent Clp protease ATP-binding subunit ClpA
MQDVPRPSDTIDGSNPNVGNGDRALRTADVSRRLMPAKALSSLGSQPLSYFCGDGPPDIHADVCKTFQRALEGNRRRAIVVIATNLGASLIMGATEASQCANVTAQGAPQEVDCTTKIRAFKQKEVPGLGDDVVGNRLGGAGALNKLTSVEQADIIDACLRDISVSLLSSTGIALEVTQEARTLLVETQSTESEGIRPVRQAMKDLVLDRLDRAVSGLESTQGLIFSVTPTGYSISHVRKA